MLTASQIAKILNVSEGAVHKIARREQWGRHKEAINQASTCVFHVTAESIRDYKIARRNSKTLSRAEKQSIKIEQQTQCINNIFSALNQKTTANKSNQGQLNGI